MPVPRCVRPLRFARRLVLAAGLLCASAVGHADEDGDHERARRALEAGEVMPLGSLLGRIEREHPGRVVDVELERDHGRWIYEVKLLRSDGGLSKLKFDARDGALVERKPRPAEKR